MQNKEKEEKLGELHSESWGGGQRKETDRGVSQASAVWTYTQDAPSSMTFIWLLDATNWAKIVILFIHVRKHQLRLEMQLALFIFFS